MNIAEKMREESDKCRTQVFEAIENFQKQTGFVVPFIECVYDQHKTLDEPNPVCVLKTIIMHPATDLPESED